MGTCPSDDIRRSGIAPFAGSHDIPKKVCPLNLAIMIFGLKYDRNDT
jgi:hypothetical protein